MKHRAFGVIVIALSSCSLFATEYILQVDSGEKSLDAAMEAAYPDAVLAADDVIVKRGSGTLLDSAGALALDSKLTFVVEEGVLVEGVARQSSTYSVSNGASVVVRVNLTNLSKSIDSLSTFNLAGAGTVAYPGALCIDSPTAASAQYIYYRLLDDATIHTTQGDCTQLSSTNEGSTKNNVFEMNGHRLTFSASSDAAYFRFRFPVTFVRPGEIVLDGVGLTHLPYKSGGKVIISGNPKKLPRVRLVNGAKLNCVDDHFAGAIEVVDCEYGTEICKLKDTPGAYSINRLVGCPRITADQTVTIKGCYSAYPEDLQTGRLMTVDGTLAFADGAGVYVERFWTLPRNVSFDLLPNSSVSGIPKLSADASDVDLTVSDTSISAKFTGDYSGKFIAYVPQGGEYTFFDVTNGMDVAEASGKPLMKIGGGILAPAKNEDVAAAEFSDLIVRNGIFTLTEHSHAPANECKTITIRSGATLRFSTAYYGFSSTSSPVVFNVEGQGFANEGGALVFTEEMKEKARQYATYNLLGDTVFSFPCGGQFNFSSGKENDVEANIFNMNGHSLTFSRPSGQGKDDNDEIRFRYAVSFNDPGELVLDNLNLTHLKGSGVYVNGRAKSRLLPLKLVNGAKVDCVDNYLTDSFSSVDCGEGTGLYAANNAEDKECSIPVLKGAPSVSGGLSVTVADLFEIRYVDLQAGRYLNSDGVLSFGEGCGIALDTVPDMEIPESGIMIAKALGGVSGRLSSDELEPYRLRARILGSEYMDCVFLCKRKGLVFNLR